MSAARGWLGLPPQPGDRILVGNDGTWAIITWKRTGGMSAIKPVGIEWLDARIAAFYRARWQLWTAIRDRKPADV